MGYSMSRQIETSGSAQQQIEALALKNELYRRAQAALEADCAQVSALFDNAPVGMLLLDRAGGVLRCNRRAVTALGLAPGEVAGVDFHDFVSDPSTVEFAEHLACACGAPGRGSSEMLLRRRDGGSFWARVRSEPSPATRDCEAGVLVSVDEIEDPLVDMQSQIESLMECADPAAAIGVACPQMLAGRVMLVDDEELALNATARVLHRMGHEIASHTDPREALAAFEAAPADYDAIIVDFQMPGMNGLALCEALLARRPGVPVLLTSAFTEEIDGVRAKELGVELILPKPLAAQEIALWLRGAVPDLI